MKRITFTLLMALSVVLCCTFGASAQVVGFDAVVTAPGQLKGLLGDDYDKIDSLVVKGPVNAADFKTMWNCAYSGRTTVFNLENAQVENNKIPDYAFSHPVIEHLPIRRVILPESITEIGYSAFATSLLEQINIPAALSKMGECSFGYCLNLKMDVLEIPEGVTEIPIYCFRLCRGIKKVVLPSSLKTIKGGAFCETGMTEINLPEGLDSIGVVAFMDSRNIEKIIIPSSCSKLGSEAFSECINLRELYISEGITNIPYHFAWACEKLEKLHFPNTLKEIGERAFEGALKLSELNLPEGLRFIGGNAFDGCQIDSLVIPSTVEYLGACFLNNTNLWQLYSPSRIPAVCGVSAQGIGAFYRVPSSAPVYVPVGTADLYRNTPGWNSFTDYIEIDEFPTPTAVETTNAAVEETAKTYWADGRLVVAAAGQQPYAVYTVDGRLVEQGTLDTSHAELDLPKGAYIVKIGTKICKVL